MKEIRGSASAVVRARPQECFSLLAAVDRYGAWNGDLVRELEVLEHAADGDPTRVRAVISVRKSPLVKTFELTVAVTTDPPHAIHLTRIPNEPSDREALELVWRIDGSGAGTKLELSVVALASFLPGFVPLGAIGDTIAQRLLGSASQALGGAV